MENCLGIEVTEMLLQQRCAGEVLVVCMWNRYTSKDESYGYLGAILNLPKHDYLGCKQ